MRLRYMLVALALAGVAAAMLLGHGAQAQEAHPTSGKLLASGFSATGGAIGPDGALYVVDAGSGGPNVVQLPPDFGGGEANWGLTARIVRIDPEDGTVTTEASNLPSFSSADGINSATDIAYMGGNWYFLITGGANYLGGDLAAWPNGVYRVKGGDNDETELVADISAFNDANPVDFPDAGPGGNPFAMEPRGSGLIVSDGNYNRLLRVQTTGAISILSAFDNIVPTGLEVPDNGRVLNTWFSPFPHDPGTSKVVSVSFPGGAVTEVASGPAQMIDITAGPDGTLYVLQFGDQQLDENAPPTASGRIYRLEDDGDLTLLVDGFVLATSLQISDDDTAYVTSLTGDVWQIENLSSIAPLPVASPTPQPTVAAPQPTPTRPGGVTAPNTGTGAAGDRASGLPLWLVLSVFAAGTATLAGAAVSRRRP